MQILIQGRVAQRMNGVYTIYKREDGTASKNIGDFTKLSIKLNWESESKFTITGKTTDTIPCAMGDNLIVYRNGEPLLSGFVTKMTVNCSNPTANVRSWNAQCEDSILMLSWRLVLGNNTGTSFGDEKDECEGYAFNRMLHYIENCCGKNAPKDRQYDLLKLPSPENRGTESKSKYNRKPLDKVLEEIGSTDGLYPKMEWYDRTGVKRIRIPINRDMTKEIIISPQYGNVSSWKKTEEYPNFNAVWVVSGKNNTERLYIYMQDDESVARYGRIEKYITKSDIKAKDKEDEETELVETAESTNKGEETADTADEYTEDEVYALLKEEAVKQLNNNRAKLSYNIEVAESNELQFMDNWQLGDIVTCVIDGEKFTSTITQVSITYEKNEEKVEPTIGDIDKGLFGEIYSLIQGVDDKVKEEDGQ